MRPMDAITPTDDSPLLKALRAAERERDEERRRADAAELVLATAWRIAPGVMHAASVEAYGPGTYSPPAMPGR